MHVKDPGPLRSCSGPPTLQPYGAYSMRLNESATLATDRVVLRPYRRWHVPRYHEWMQDEQLREATA